MGDSVLVVCVPYAADTAFQIHCLERSAYAAVLRAFCAQSNLLSRAKHGCLAELRYELKIFESEHRECLGKARSDQQINSLSTGLHSKGNTCNAEVTKDTPDLACVLPDAEDTVFQIHNLERSAYASVLRAFCASRNHLSVSQVKLLIKLRNELRISHVEHKEVLVKVSSNENIKSLRKFSLANLSILAKADPSFDAHALVHDKIGSTGQVSTSSTSCLSLLQQSPISEHSMSTTRDIGISDSSNGAKEGPYFEPHAVVSAKRFKSVNGHALTCLKYASSDQLPVAVSAVMVKGRTDETLDGETVSCEVKSGNSSSPISQEKHSDESNACQVPSCADRDSQESGKSKAEVPGMRASGSLGVTDKPYDQSCGNKNSNLEHGSEIINLCLTANLLDKVERLLRESPDPANLEKAKSILKVQEKDLLDALVKLSEAAYDAAYFSANGQPDNTNTHDYGKANEEVQPNPANSSDETTPGTTRQAGAGAGNHVKMQGVAVAALTLPTAPPSLMQMQTCPPLAPASPYSAPAALGESSRGLSTVQPVLLGSASAPPAPRKTRPMTKMTAEQRWRMWEFAHRFGWSIRKAGADAVDALCAQVGLPERVLRSWLVNNRHLAKVPPPSSPPSWSRTKITAEQRWRMWEFARRFGWSIQKAGADAVDASCAQVGVPEHALRNWMNNNKRLGKVPPPSLPSPPPPSHHQVQDHPPAATPPQGSVTEQGKPPEPEAAAPAPADDGTGKEDEDDEASEAATQSKPPEPEAAAPAPADDGTGKEDEDDEASEAATQRGRSHRDRKPNKRYADSFFLM